MQSLHGFCKQHELPKSSVRRWLNTNGFDTSDGLSEEAIEAATAEFLTPRSKVQSQVGAAPIEIDDGNHRESRALTVQAEATSLEQFRTDRIRQGLANPSEFMTGLTSMLDQIEDGMDKAEAQQEQELLQTRQTKRQAERRIEQFRRRADEYKIKSDILASIQNDELEQLEDLASEVNRLGKPSAG